LFTGGRQHRLYRDWFFGQLAEALRADDSLRLLLSIHIDRLMDLLPYEWVLAAADELDGIRFPLEPLDFDSALKAVRGPLQGTGRVFAEGAAEQIVDDLIKVRTRTSGSPREWGVDPVQLQVACEALWRSLPPDTTEITRGDVRDHVDRALSRHYDQVIQEICAGRGCG
jgi:hypothetical protein